MVLYSTLFPPFFFFFFGGGAFPGMCTGFDGNLIDHQKKKKIICESNWLTVPEAGPISTVEVELFFVAWVLLSNVSVWTHIVVVLFSYSYLYKLK